VESENAPWVRSRVRSFPSGTLTFLFSDVEGSTRLVRECGDAKWADLLDTHRQLLRAAFAAHGGHEVGTQGDSLFAVFTRATDAMAAAIGGQQALEQHCWPAATPIRVRVGLHTGEALAHADNYVGHEVHRASRICDAGHGGQIVVSQATADLIRESLPSDVELSDLGEHSLKDIGGKQRLFQLSAASLPSHFPKLRSLVSPSNLPAQRSSFVGRSKEIQSVRQLLGQHRLVSLTGIGGSGKTRIALEVGTAERDDFSDGVFFIDLSPVSDPDLVSQAVASGCALAIGDTLAGELGGSTDDRLVASLALRNCLLLVDNCEHLIDAVADLLDRILGECPNIKLLATSREALGIDGEQILPIPSLAVPNDPTLAESNEAVMLFAERARSVKPTFALAAHNLTAVVEICRRLDGIPLAIELAATRIAHLSAGQIAERLEDRFRLLTGGRRRIQRQQTLAAALDWSHGDRQFKRPRLDNPHV
jgi:class 3 adenylate cyclase